LASSAGSNHTSGVVSRHLTEIPSESIQHETAPSKQDALLGALSVSKTLETLEKAPYQQHGDPCQIRTIAQEIAPQYPRR